MVWTDRRTRWSINYGGCLLCFGGALYSWGRWAAAISNSGPWYKQWYGVRKQATASIAASQEEEVRGYASEEKVEAERVRERQTSISTLAAAGYAQDNEAISLFLLFIQ